jgi:tetratricopeptide (TPR) repeat protein
MDRLGQQEFEHALAHWYIEKADLLNHYRNLETATDHYLKAAALLGEPFGFRNAGTVHDALNICMRLASILLRQGRHAEAKAYFRKALELCPDDPSVQDGGGEHVLRHGTREEIVAYFERVLAINPESRMARFALEVQKRFPEMVEAMLESYRPGTAAHSGKRRGIIVLPVWGEQHLELFLDYVLPSLLAPGNFPALAKAYDLHFEIFTTAACRRKIKANERFQRLDEFLTPRFRLFPKSLMAFSDHHVGRFQLLQLSHYVTLECARKIDADVIFALPDNIVNDGFYGALGRHMLQSKKVKAVACCGFRLYVGDILPNIDRDFRAPDGTVSIPSDGIMRLVMDHLDDTWFVDSNRFAVSPFFLIWRVGKEGLFVRATHFQPYGLRARYLNKPLWATIDPVDAQFMHRHFDDTDDIVLIQDKEMCLLDAGVAPILDPYEIEGENRFDEYIFARFLHTYDTPLHRKYLKAPVRLHLGSPSPKWKRVEKESAAMIERVFALIDGFERMAPERPHWALREDNESFGNSSTAGGQAAPSGRRAGVPARAKGRRHPAAIPCKREKTEKTEKPEKAKKKTAARHGKRPGDKVQKTP